MKPQDLLARLEAGYEYDPMYGQLCNERDKLKAENAKLRELLQRLFVEYRYLRVRPRKTYLQHEGRMRAIEKEMSELGVEVES